MFIERIILLFQFGPFKGQGSYGLGAESRAGGFDSRLGKGEFYNAEKLLKMAPTLRQLISGKTILDFGSGYGGKTVFYSQYSKEAYGIEPFQHVVDYSRLFAASWGASNISFEVCDQLRIPFADDKFDVVISHDVLEHVDNPSATLSEIFRVLKPGGKALIIFPSYDGAFSHHLDYVTLIPCLHWFFKPESIVKAVNKCLISLNSGTAQQPTPKLNWNRRRYVLPTLNGLTYKDFLSEARKYFEVVSEKYVPVGYDDRNSFHKIAKFISISLMPFSKERFALGGVFELTKPL